VVGLKLHLSINGEKREFDIEPKEMLLDVLRDNGYKSVKRGCSSADCGTCTVLKDGKAILSCTTFAASVEGCEITTTEALGEHGQLDKIQQAFVDESAFQCGFCAPGMLMSTKEFIDEMKKNPKMTFKVSEIKDRFSGNLCRCTGYESQMKAIKTLIQDNGGEVIDDE